MMTNDKPKYRHGDRYWWSTVARLSIRALRQIGFMVPRKIKTGPDLNAPNLFWRASSPNFA